MTVGEGVQGIGRSGGHDQGGVAEGMSLGGWGPRAVSRGLGSNSDQSHMQTYLT